MIVGSGTLLGCGLKPATLREAPPLPPQSIDHQLAKPTPSATGTRGSKTAITPAIAPELVDALAGSSEPRILAAPPSLPPIAETPPSLPSSHVLESPTLPGPTFREDELERSTPVLLGQRAETAARWNLGGSSREEHPIHQPRYHPGTRVIVDAALAGVFGPTKPPAAIRQQVEARARARGYWPLRVCYESSWRAGLDGPTEDKLRATLLASGKVQATRSLDASGPAALTQCLRHALTQIHWGPLPASRIDADLRIRFWPGDAPLARDATISDDACADAAVSEPLLQAAELWQTSTAEIGACVAPALARDSQLWGRLALLARYDTAGQPSSVAEFQTTFPDPAVVSCVTGILERSSLGTQPCAVEVVFALRVGHPELD